MRLILLRSAVLENLMLPIRYIWALLASVLTLSSMGQSLPCGEEGLYLIMSPSISKNSELYRVRIDQKTGEADYDRLAKLDRQIDAAGYRVTDGLIYGLDRNTKELIRIYGDGRTEALGKPLYLDTTYQYYAGTIGPHGRRLYVVGRNPSTGYDDQLFRINLNHPDWVTGPSALHSTSFVRLDDFAYDPLYGSIFGFNSVDQRLVQLSGGQVSFFNFLNTNQSSGMGSIFFDGAGQLFGYGFSNGGSTEANLFSINKFNGSVTKFDGGPGQRWTDACACPYYVRLEKTVSPREVLPCGEVEIRYKLSNHGGSAFSLDFFADTLPPYLTITEISPINFSYDSISGLGSHILYIDRPAIYLGEDSIVIKALVDEEAKGRYESHAVMGPLPLMLGGTLHSDNPETLVENDPSEIVFLPQGQLELDQQLQVLCPGETATLHAPGGGLRYLWSDGSTGEELTIDRGGLYWLEVENECGIFRDSLWVEGRTEPLSVDLGPDLLVNPGDEIQLNPMIHPSGGTLQYAWSSPEDSDLCRDCPMPIVLPQQPSVYRLQITDEEGCSARDSLVIALRKVRKIFAPTAFSPNGDQINDIFYLQGFGEVQIRSLKIFNRWGRVLYVREGGTINDTRHGWNGQSGRASVPTGVYTWTATLQFPDGEVEVFGGNITLIR